MKKTITILILLLTVGFLSFSQDIKPISPLFKNLQSPSFSFMIGGNPWIYKGTAFNPTPWTELAGWTNVKDTLNNYFTKSIVQAKIDSLANVKQDTITLTTIGTSGAATFIGSTLNIPQYSGGAEPGHDSLTIAPGSVDYFEVIYPQIFSGQKLIDSLGVINTKIAGKEPILTKGNLTAGSSKVTIGGTGTNALIGSGASVDINEANIVHQNISGHGTNTHTQIDTHITSDGDLSSTNEIQDLSLSGNTLSLSGDASAVDLSGYAPTFSGTANYIPKFGLSGATLENSGLLWDNNLLKITVGTNKYITIDTESSSGIPSDGVVLGFSRSSDGIKGLFELTTFEGDFIMRARSNYRFYTNATEKVRITESGNIGVGYSTGTEIDNHKLAVNGNAFFNGFINTTGYKLSGVDLFGSLTTGYLPYWDGSKLANSRIRVENLTNTIIEKNLSIWYKTDASEGAAPTIIPSSTDRGFKIVEGFGTGDFIEFLDDRRAKIQTLSGTGTRLVSASSDGTLANISNASGYLHNDGTNMSFTSIPAAVTSISAGNGMNFMTITGTGSVTLGTPTTLTASTTNAVTTTSHTHRITGFLPLTGGTLTGAVTSNNSFTGTNFILSSDKRLKQGIRTLTNTDWVERIKFVRYEMKSNPEIERYGVIAQDVEEVNKYLVHTDEYGIKSVSYIDLLVAKIANLEKRISELENKKKRHEK